MKNILFLLFSVQFSLIITEAQSQFQLAVGSTGLEYAYSIKPTIDGGIVTAGGTTSFGGGNFYLIKIAGNGSLQWTRTIGGAGYEGAFFIVQTTDGGYAATGYTESFGAGGADFYIVKLDSAGNLQWNRTVGGTLEDVALAIVQTSDGGYAAAGYTYSFGSGDRDFLIVKLDSGGNFQWSKTFGGANYEFAESLIQTSDGGFAIAGFTYSFGAGNGDFYIVKIDAAGTLQWSKTIGGAEPDYCLSIIQTSDGGYTAAGPTSSYGAGNNDFYIIKLSTIGAIEWSRTVGGTGLDYAESVIQTTDGGYAVGGLTYSFGAGNMDMYVVKLSSGGDFVWNRTIGGPEFDYAESIIQTSDGGFAGGGHTNSFGAGDYDAYIVKLDAAGNSCGNTLSPVPVTGSGGVTGNPNTLVSSPIPLVTSPAIFSGSGGIITNICMVGIQPISSEIPLDFRLSQNYPNPFNPMTNVKFQIPNATFVELKVYDMLGREVAALVKGELSPGTYKVEWDAGNQPSGVYYYRLTANNYSETKKMVLLK